MTVPDNATPSYGLMHRRARAAIGSTCTECGTGGRLHAALVSEPSGTVLYDEDQRLFYSTSTDDYRALCPSCHWRHDETIRIQSGRPPTLNTKPRLPDDERRQRARDRERARRARIKADPVRYAAYLERGRRDCAAQRARRRAER